MSRISPRLQGTLIGARFYFRRLAHAFVECRALAGDARMRCLRRLDRVDGVTVVEHALEAPDEHVQLLVAVRIEAQGMDAVRWRFRPAHGPEPAQLVEQQPGA